jgi:serine/threonine-protein kinase
MSPEQALGRVADLDRRTDVYALGCLLYEMLTLHPAFEGYDVATLLRVQKGDFPPVAERNPERTVPQPLREVSAKAMALDPDDRHETAEAFGSELRAWLDGRSEEERRHREAEALAAQGKEAAERYERLKVEVRKAEDAAEAVAKEFKSWQPVAEKRPMLEARQREESLRTEVALAFAESMSLLTAALTQEEGNRTARAALAALWAGRLADAELRGDKADTAYALEMMRRYDDGAFAHVIAGNGALTLATEPEGAHAILYRFVERDGVLVPEKERDLGPTPVGTVDLPMGSYLVTLRHPGFRDVSYPVRISPDREWDGMVCMRADDEIGEGFAYVPGGAFLCGGVKDMRELHGEVRESREIDLPDFAIAKSPVTFRDYAEFLAHLPEEEAEARKPHWKGVDEPYMERGEDGTYRPLPHIVQGRARERCLAEHGQGFEMEIPVIGITFEDAEAYCAWKNRETGQE